MRVLELEEAVDALEAADGAPREVLRVELVLRARARHRDRLRGRRQLARARLRGAQQLAVQVPRDRQLEVEQVVLALVEVLVRGHLRPEHVEVVAQRQQLRVGLALLRLREARNRGDGHRPRKVLLELGVGHS